MNTLIFWNFGASDNIEVNIEVGYTNSSTYSTLHRISPYVQDILVDNKNYTFKREYFNNYPHVPFASGEHHIFIRIEFIARSGWNIVQKSPNDLLSFDNDYLKISNINHDGWLMIFEIKDLDRFYREDWGNQEFKKVLPFKVRVNGLKTYNINVVIQGKQVIV